MVCVPDRLPAWKKTDSRGNGESVVNWALSFSGLVLQIDNKAGFAVISLQMVPY